MITIEANNPPVSLAIHSRGFFSRAIHSRGRYLRQKLSQTTYAAQLNHKLRSFYAKQTQFAGHQNDRNIFRKQALRKYSPSWTEKKQTQFQFPHRRSESIPTSREHAGNRTKFRTRHPQTAQPTINMQNKPNFRRHKMNVTFYEQKDYRNLRLPGQRKNKPNFELTASAYTRFTPAHPLSPLLLILTTTLNRMYHQTND
jgi:hypothetical protein